MLNQLPDLNDSDQNVAEMAKNAFMGLQDGVDENPADPNAVQVIDPIAQLLDLGEEIASMKWILNDSFLTVVTTKNNFIVFDSLLNYFNLTLYSSLNSDLSQAKYLNLKYGKSLTKLASHS